MFLSQTKMEMFKINALSSQRPRNRNTAEPRFDEPLCNEVHGITNDIPRPSNSNTMYMEKNPDTRKPRYI